MTKENLLIRVFGSCETMANASVICTNKTSTFTQNEMSVVTSSIGIYAMFVWKLNKNPARAGNQNTSCPNTKDFAVDTFNLNSTLTSQLVKLLNASIAINSTAFEDVDSKSSATVFIGCKMETALLKFTKDLGWANYKNICAAANVILMILFSSECKSMGCVMQLPDRVHCLFIKGVSEILMHKSTRYVIVHRDIPDGTGVEIAPIGKLEEDNISCMITFYASRTLRTIALCYRDFRSWPPEGTQLIKCTEGLYLSMLDVFATWVFSWEQLRTGYIILVNACTDGNQEHDENTSEIDQFKGNT